MESRKNVRERYLTQCVVEKKSVNIVMKNGYHVSGSVTDFDDDVIAAAVNGEEWLLFDGAVSTIKPAPEPTPYPYAGQPEGRRFL